MIFLTSSQALLSVMTLDFFPQGVINNFSSVFNIEDNSGLIQHFQEIIDTVNAGVKTIVDDCPNFIPLGIDDHIPHKLINVSGLQDLKGM